MMNAKEYQAYLKTKKWKDRANKCKNLSGNKCSRCGSTKNLIAHHLTYLCTGNESQDQLQCLCSQCHTTIHQIREVENNHIIISLNSIDVLLKLKGAHRSILDILAKTACNNHGDTNTFVLSASLRKSILNSIGFKSNTIITEAIKSFVSAKIIARTDNDTYMHNVQYMINPYILFCDGSSPFEIDFAKSRFDKILNGEFNDEGEVI